jgi:putative hemolysin
VSEPWSLAWVGLALAGAAALFLLEFSLSMLLLSIAAVSRVALRRMIADSRGRLRFLEDVKDPPFSRRTALNAVRLASLIGGSALAGLAAHGAGLQHAWLIGVLAGLIVGVLMLETLAARAVALRDPRAALRASAPLVEPVYALTYPILAPIHAVLKRVGRLASGTDDRDEDQEGEVDALIEVGEREGILEGSEGEMLRGIVDLGDTRAREIMTPRTDIVAIPAEATVAEARSAVLRSGHSRLPVYRGSIDNVVGILYVRDMLRAWEEGREGGSAGDLVRPAHFVPETRLVSELLGEMRTRQPMALVVDEYGSLAGLVTLEDLLEEIVGDIRDEHEVEESLMREESDGSWILHALVHVEELEELFALDVGEREFDTVGGLVVTALGRVPAPGETFVFHGLAIEVLQADGRRVFRVRVRRAGVAAGGALGSVAP